MRKLVAISHVTLDGVMQAPGGPDEDPTGGFELGGWAVGYFDDALMEEIRSAMETSAAGFVGSSWNNSQLIAGDVATEVAKLKEGDGPELQVHGSTDLLQTLLAAGLIDELRLLIFPVVAGSGKRLFGDGASPGGLKLVSSTTSSSGVIRASYEPAGEIQKGSFEFEEPTKLD